MLSGVQGFLNIILIVARIENMNTEIGWKDSLLLRIISLFILFAIAMDVQ